MSDHRRRCFGWITFLAVVLAAGAARAESRHFTPRESEGASLAYVNGVPVLSLSGSPEEIGRQLASLVGPATERLTTYPKQTFGRQGDEKSWSRLVKASRELWPNIPDDHRTEIDTVVRHSSIDRDALLAGNVMMDVYRGMGCSSLIVEPSRSASGGPLFGRNLDFFSNGYLHQYTLLTVVRPKGKHAFASVGFAGLFGCLSGMNDAGLSLAVHEVLVSRDGSRLFNPKGVPYTFALRRVLEECTTVEEAERLMRSMERTTMYSVSVCDSRRGIVLELTPKSVERRDAVAGLCPCTNHFRTPELAVFPLCRRFDALVTDVPKKLSVEDVIAHMHAANMGRLTLQTMV
ncbi:MAG TPA: C45 family peptidase, partial [Thermoguttaceae bacterium]|nr:C45 family peptidase [Thermoguttaceae bacterium]